MIRPVGHRHSAGSKRSVHSLKSPLPLQMRQLANCGLTDLRGFANLLDLFGSQRLDTQQAQLVEFAQGDQVHHTGLVQPLGPAERLRHKGGVMSNRPRMGSTL